MSDSLMPADRRAQVEREEKWREITPQMPYLSFPKSCMVAMIPPFGGAIARFRVQKDSAIVSVYADFYEALGYFGGPHWELYPDADGDNARFAINDTAGLLREIARSLRKQKRTPRNV